MKKIDLDALKDFLNIHYDFYSNLCALKPGGEMEVAAEYKFQMLKDIFIFIDTLEENAIREDLFSDRGDNVINIKSKVEETM